METKFRWAYIGAGSICKKTADEITKAGHEIVTVYSRTFEKASDFAKHYGATPCHSFEEAVNRDDVDGVYVGTPHTSHKEYAIAAMRLKKPVLCEKPIGINLSEVEEIINVAKEEDVYFTEAMWTWFAPVALQVKAWVDEGKIGEFKECYGSFCIPGFVGKKSDHRLINPLTAGGSLLDLGIYPITYMYNLFGMPKEIHCEGTLKGGIDTEEIVTLTYEKGKCVLKSSLNYPEEKMEIKGSLGEIKVGPMFHSAKKAKLKTTTEKDVMKEDTTYANEFTLVAEEIKAGKKESDYVPFSHTIDCMKIMDECRRQLGLRYEGEE
ncbi:MAG: Gfo/Idh/MocA family oxidoreductase [Lachnospiraceae bacterium]|nr:Gfo/Idh/MocA family oxidoreductase [Lachnospiraceae bacterium]